MISIKLTFSVSNHPASDGIVQRSHHVHQNNGHKDAQSDPIQDIYLKMLSLPLAIAKLRKLCLDPIGAIDGFVEASLKDRRYAVCCINAVVFDVALASARNANSSLQVRVVVVFDCSC